MAQVARSAWGSQTRGRSGRSSPRAPGDYWTLSTRPLHALALLLPLIALYEIGSVWWLEGDGARRTIRAEKLLSAFFELFGSVGLIAPGIMIIAVLLAWHVLSRDAWRLRGNVVAGMALEAALWSLPLLVLGALVQRLSLGGVGIEAALQTGAEGAGGGGGGGGVGAAPGPSLASLSVWARVSIAIGAGLYEELLFRMVAIALLHLIVKDLLKLSENAARAVAVAGSALAFALYHDQTFAGGAIQWPALAFFMAAGVFFACLYIFRGLGIVAGAHAAYDIFVLAVLPG